VLPHARLELKPRGRPAPRAATEGRGSPRSMRHHATRSARAGLYGEAHR
jgi:hypothetical protein